MPKYLAVIGLSYTWRQIQLQLQVADSEDADPKAARRSVVRV